MSVRSFQQIVDDADSRIVDISPTSRVRYIGDVCYYTWVAKPGVNGIGFTVGKEYDAIADDGLGPDFPWLYIVADDDGIRRNRPASEFERV